MRTGVVLEKTEKTAVILKSDGTFETVKRGKNWEIGDVIWAKEVRQFKSLSIAACIIICLLIGISSQMYFTKAMVISVDDSQSMEFGVNRFGRIISVKGYNKESEDIMKDMEIKYKSYEEVLKNMIAENAGEDVQAEETYMLITVQLDNKKQEDGTMQRIESIAGNSKTYGREFQIDCMLVDNETLETAHGHGMTAGIYSKVQELGKINIDINMKDYSHCNINQINKEIQQCHAEKNNHGKHHGKSGH